MDSEIDSSESDTSEPMEVTCHPEMAQCFHVSVFCWGNTANGELGVGGQEEMVVAEPRHLQTFQQAHHVRDGAVGRNHTALILDTGHVYTCGSNEMGQLGRQLGYSKFDLVGGLKLHHIRQVSTKGEHTLALSEAGQVFSWGCNLHGQLGYPTDSGQPSLEPRLIKKLALVHVVQVACGNSHSMALALDGQLYTWGSNQSGQLGLGRLEPQVTSPEPVKLLHGIPICLITAGGQHSFVLSTSGTLFGWGNNTFGQLGINTDTNSWEPKLVFSLRSHYIHYVSCGENHTAALTKDGGVFTFGAGMYGQLGHGSRNNEILPRKVIELMGSTVTQIACGRCHTLAYVAHPPKLYAFGQGGNGQLGTGQFTNSTVPMAVRGPWSTARTSLQEDGPSSRKRSGSESRIHRRNFIYSSAPSPGEEIMAPHVHSFTVYRVMAGGDQSFVLSTNSSVPPLDYRSLPCPEASILKMSKELANQATEQTDSTSDVLTYLEIIFCSAACLNNSFLKPSNKHFNCTASNSGLDYSSIFASFSKLEDSPNLMEIVRSSLEEQLLPQLKKFPPLESEALRVFLILPFCHLFHRPEQHLVSLIVPFAQSLLSLQPRFLTLIEKWWAKMEVYHFKNLVQIYKKSIVHLIGSTWKPLDMEKHNSLRTSLEFLAKLNKVNTENNGLIPFQDFYIPEITERVDVAMDYTKWLMSSVNRRVGHVSNPASLHLHRLKDSSLFFCDYSFVFDAHAKTVILQTDSSVRMAQAVEEAQSHNFAGLFLGSAAFPIVQPFLVLNVSRSNLVQDTIMQLSAQSTRELKKPLKVAFIGEEAVDAGGVTKEFFLLLLTEILDPKFGMFEEFPETRCIWFRSQSFEEDMMFYLIGIICGLAIYNFTIINLPFPLVLYKKLLNEQVQLEDLKGLSPQTVKSLKDILSYEGEDFEDVFMLNFEVTREEYGTHVSTPLKEDGKHIPVTLENRKEYVDLYVDYVLNRSVQRQFAAFSNGFLKVVESRVLKLFHAQELMALVIGNEEYNWEEFEQNALYKNEYHKNHPTIRMFWSVFHSLTHEEKKKFLLFLTGSDRIPMQGMKTVQIVIQPMKVSDRYLPVAHTCFNILDLPAYSSPAVMRERLLQVIQHTQGFGLA